MDQIQNQNHFTKSSFPSIKRYSKEKAIEVISTTIRYSNENFNELLHNWLLVKKEETLQTSVQRFNEQYLQ